MEDVLKIKSNFVRNIIEKIISNFTKNKWGHAVDLYFNEIEIEHSPDEGSEEVFGRISFDFKIPKDLFYKVVTDAVDKKIDKLLK